MSTTPLPPTSRDFEIHRLSLIELLSTRRIAEKFEISQTRVRQIIHEVSTWLAETLPIPTEADIERERRLAIHLAAAQLQHQIEQLQIFWQQTSDPKYLRQQTRAILALARLGVTPGALDALAAGEGEAPAEPPLNDLVTNDLVPSVPAGNAITRGSSLASSSPSPPPPGDCSPEFPAPSPAATDSRDFNDSTTSPPTDSAKSTPTEDVHLAGLNLIEKRLLTLLDYTAPDDTDRRQSLTKTLTTVRRERASYILQLTPDSPVLSPTDHPTPGSRNSLPLSNLVN